MGVSLVDFGTRAAYLQLYSPVVRVEARWYNESEGLHGDIGIDQCVVAPRALVRAIPHELVSREASLIFLWEVVEDVRRAEL